MTSFIQSYMPSVTGIKLCHLKENVMELSKVNYSEDISTLSII